MIDAFGSKIPDETAAPPPADATSPDLVARDVNDLGAKAQVRATQYIINASRARIDKRREELNHQADVAKNGPRGEKRSAVLTQRVELVWLKDIIDDPNFVNLRLQADEEELAELSESMKHEGLKVPITVIAIGEDIQQFYVRAGFRRSSVARRLGWQRIPAIILPHNTPTIEEYWTNILENSARSRLHTYEIAVAARTMRDLFHIPPLEFAVRAGYSQSYVCNLLRCLDRLPDEVLEAWRTKAPIPVDLYVKWSIMEPAEAVKMMLSYAGRNPTIVKDWQPPSRNHQPLLLKMASARGLQRMQQVRFAISVARNLDDPTRTLCLKLVDFCSGAREDLPGIFNPRQKMRIYTQRRKKDLLPLEPLEPGELPPPPTLDPDDDDDK